MAGFLPHVISSCFLLNFVSMLHRTVSPGSLVFEVCEDTSFSASNQSVLQFLGAAWDEEGGCCGPGESCLLQHSTECPLILWVLNAHLCCGQHKYVFIYTLSTGISANSSSAGWLDVCCSLHLVSGKGLQPTIPWSGDRWFWKSKQLNKEYEFKMHYLGNVKSLLVKLSGLSSEETGLYLSGCMHICIQYILKIHSIGFMSHLEKNYLLWKKKMV